jgi:hypothetical protein
MPGTRKVLVLFSAILLAACRDPRQIVVTSSNQQEVMQKVSDSKKMSDDEKRLFALALMRAGVTKAFHDASGRAQASAGPAGKTVGQLIEQERRFESEQHRRDGNEEVPPTRRR